MSMPSNPYDDNCSIVLLMKVALFAFVLDIVEKMSAYGGSYHHETAISIMHSIKNDEKKTYVEGPSTNSPDRLQVRVRFLQSL